MTVRPDLPPLLVPRPVDMVLMGGRVHVDPALAAEHIDPGGDMKAPGPEAYRLRITSAVQAPLMIEARSEAGIRHARATLAQLVRQYGAMLPCMVIEDGPAFAARGYMLDISRSRVPAMKHLFEIVDLLASLKYNHLQLYTEHTFAYAGHEDVWRDASPMTPAEVRELDTYCRHRGIELAANQNCFGHLETWLRLPRYAPLAETHGEWYFETGGQRWPRHGPNSLCPTDPASLKLVEDLLGQLLPCFSSLRVNIGCDETFDVGFGRSLEAVRVRGGEGGRAEVYFDFVNAVADVVRRHGKRPMFWADIAMRHPESLSRIPQGATALAWGYEPAMPWDQWLSRLGGVGVESWVCPGTSSWCSITGRTSEHWANIGEAAQAGRAAGAAGMLLTDWGDAGHRQQWPISLNPIAQGAQAAWSGGEADARAVSLHVWHDEMLAASKWCAALGDVDLPLRRICGRRREVAEPGPLRNASALFADLHLPLAAAADDDDALLRTGLMNTPESLWHEASGRLAALASSLPASVTGLARDELNHTLRVGQLAARRAILRRQGSISSADRHALSEELRTIINEHCDLWVRRSHKGGLSASAAQYRRIMEDLAS